MRTKESRPEPPQRLSQMAPTAQQLEKLAEEIKRRSAEKAPAEAN